MKPAPALTKSIAVADGTGRAPDDFAINFPRSSVDHLRILVVVADSFPPSQHQASLAGREPSIDMLELARHLGADLLTFDSLRSTGPEAPSYPLLQAEARTLPPFPARIRRSPMLLARLAAEAWGRAARYDVVFLTGEDLALPYAALCAARGKRGRCVSIAHYLNPLKKSLPLHHSMLGRFIDRWVLYSPVQHLFAEERLRTPCWKLELIPFHADAGFYAPAGGQRRERDLVVAAGFERRDYATLFAAARMLGLRLELGVGSPWSRFRQALPPLPENATNRFRTRDELRDLYRRAAAVVVPLQPTDFQAGVSVAMEAMATAAPVIVSRTRGLAHLLNHGVDGQYAEPGNAEGLAEAIAHVQARPYEAESMGRTAREKIVQALSTGHFVDRLAWILRAAAADEQTAQFHLLPNHIPIRARNVA